MQHRVGRAAQSDDHGDGVLEGLACKDVAWPDAGLYQLHRRLARATAVRAFVIAHGLLRGAARKRQTKCFDSRGHRVGRVHSATTARAGNGSTFDLSELRIGDLPGGAGTDCLEDGNDVTALPARTDRSAIHEYRRTVQARD